jgi:hypothetical protein
MKKKKTLKISQTIPLEGRGHEEPIRWRGNNDGKKKKKKERRKDD